jgi:hypothetical protein
MTLTAELHPDTPFSLGAAAAFGFGPRAGRPKPDTDEMRLAFVTDDLGHHAGVHLVQRPDGTIIAAIDSGVLLRATGVTDVLTLVRRGTQRREPRSSQLVPDGSLAKGGT